MAVHITNEPPGELRFEPSPRWVRAAAGGETVVDSRRALLVWEPGRVVPRYCFPRDDVRMELLRPTGDGRRFALEVGGRVREDAAWTYDDDDLANHVAFDWSAMDAWFEEDEEVLVHPRDPHKRIDVLASSRHVVVALDGEVVADTKRPRLLFETGLPTRYYIPSEDVRTELLEATSKKTRCPYKGLASYWTVAAHDDVAWTYRDPLPAVAEIKDLIAFFNERADITVDGELEERPQTQWSRVRPSGGR